jgi:ribosomal protein S18 acetylase RimI-like enzyme
MTWIWGVVYCRVGSLIPLSRWHFGMPELRAAHTADNGQLLALTRATSMPGVIGLRIDREPDFFRLLSLRGQGTVFVHEEGGDIQGCLSVSHRPVWAAGGRRTLWYVGDLKVHPDCREEGVGAALAVSAFNHLLEQGADLLACVVARGNRRVLTFLEGRFQIPSFRSLGKLSVLMTLSSRRGPGGRFLVREGTWADASELADIFRESSRDFELAPALEEEDWREAIGGDPALCQVLVVAEKGRIQATGWLFDVQWAKQHVVISLPGGLSALAAPLRPLGGLSPAFRIPREGDTVSLLCLRHLAVRGGNMGALGALVQEARRRAHAGGFPFVIYGLHERDPFRRAFRGLPHFTMGSEVLLASLQGNPDLVDEVALGVPVEDYALT